MKRNLYQIYLSQRDLETYWFIELGSICMINDNPQLKVCRPLPLFAFHEFDNNNKKN